MNKETKRERFVRLAEKRVDKVIDRLRVLGGCANRRMYEYTPADIEKIRNAIDEEFAKVLLKFSNKPEVFSLGSKEK